MFHFRWPIILENIDISQFSQAGGGPASSDTHSVVSESADVGYHL